MNKIYKFKRINSTLVVQNSGTVGTVTTNDATQITLGTAAADTVGYQFGASMAFRLGNVQNYSDLSGLFDQYRILGVKVTIIPTSDSATTNSSGYLPTLYWCIDADDETVPTEAEMRQKQNVKITRLSGPRSIYISHPKALYDVSATVAAASGVANGWINANDVLTRHFGLKMFLKNVDLRAQPGTTTAFRIDATYYVGCKNPQ